MSTVRLLVACPDRPGIVAAISGFFARRGANITSSDQHTTDPSGGRFLLRMEVEAPLEGLHEAFEGEVATPFGMEWSLTDATHRRRVAILVSREEHCLLDLLWRWRRGELPCEVVLVASNHDVAREDVERFGVTYLHVPVPPAGKPEAERALLAALHEAQVELVVLARYMQVLSADFLEALGAPAINIHHSFLPAFVGADPYRRALERGVKIIGATAHYVTEELDAGPIIEQDVERVSHRAAVGELVAVGADIERRVLARAVQWHLQDRVLVYGGRTVVF